VRRSEEGWRRDDETDGLFEVLFEKFSSPLESMLNEIRIKLKGADRDGSLFHWISALIESAQDKGWRKGETEMLRSFL
jgi:hypothetical protein